MSKFLSISIFCFLSTFLFANELTVQEALKGNKIKTSLVSNGQALDEGMVTAEIQNTSMGQLRIKIPVGTKLTASEDDRQNLILVQEEVLSLAPNTKKSVSLKGMCIQAGNRSPGSDVAYTFGDVLKGDLLECAQVINEKKILNSCGQEAIWAFTDNHDVGWIHAENENELALRKFVADKKGVPNPWFTTSHTGGNNQLSRNFNPMQPSEEYYNLNGAEIKGDFQWKQSAKKKLTFAVYDANGRMLRKFFENKAFDKGEFTFKFFYKTTKNLRGTYYAKLTSGAEIVQEASFTL
jgi:hypothetical protein